MGGDILAYVPLSTVAFDLKTYTVGRLAGDVVEMLPNAAIAHQIRSSERPACKSRPDRLPSVPRTTPEEDEIDVHKGNIGAEHRLMFKRCDSAPR